VARVRGVVEDLRQFSRGGALDDRSSDSINDVVRRVETLVGVRGVGIAVSAELAASRAISARPGQLEQVLLNLFINAKRSAGAGCRLTVKTWDHDRGGIAISVTDNGPGIPESERGKIFLPFYSSTSSAAEGGTGIGLAVARRIVKEHGGTIDVADSADGGAIFTLWFPAHAPSRRGALARDR
jgi:signal transduction histidine kinase